MSGFLPRADIVGSFSRPPHLLEARQQWRDEKITLAQLRVIEDEAIKEVVRKQVAAGLKIVTDGEFRRDLYWLDFWLGFEGIEPAENSDAIIASDAVKKTGLLSAPGSGWSPKKVFLGNTKPHCCGKLKFKPDHPELAGFEFLKSITPAGVVPKVVIPSPSFLGVFEKRPSARVWATPPCYSNQDQYFADISRVYREAIDAFYARGARYIQIDEPTLLMVGHWLSLDVKDQFAIVNTIATNFVKIMKPVMTGLPQDLKIAIHICRGNGGCRFTTAYGYEDIAWVFKELPFAWAVLEYDNSGKGNSSGGFKTLKALYDAAPKTHFVLGVVTTKDKAVESVEYVEKELRDAGTIVPLDLLGATSGCGFGTSKEGQGLEEDVIWAKVKVWCDACKKIWGTC